MTKSSTRIRLAGVLLSLGIELFAASCGQSSVTPTVGTATPSATLSSLSRMQTTYAIASPTASKTPSPSETPTPRPTLGPVLPLNPDGPWLLFLAASDRGNNARNLWATNADGTHMNKLVDENVVTFAVQPGSSLASGVLVAFASQTDYNSRDLKLKLLHLPDGQVETITPLINDRDGQSQIDAVDAAYAVANDGLVWSDNGQQLAFVGQIDGASMDVYRYEVATHSIHWLSSGPYQAFRLKWSPDQRWIIHEAFDFVGMGGGNIQGVWSADANGSGSVALASSGFTGDIEYLGWQGASRILLADYHGSDAESIIKSVDITTGEANDILTGEYITAAYSRADDTWLLADPFNDNSQQRVRLFRDGKWTNIPVQNLVRVWWSDLYNTFIGSAFHDNKLYTISSAGQVTELPITGYWQTSPDPPMIIPSPDKTLWAWHDYEDNTQVSELFVGEPKAKPTYIIGEHEGMNVQQVIWSPDSQRLLLFTEHGLWAAERPNFEPVLVIAASSKFWYAGDPQWVK